MYMNGVTAREIEGEAAGEGGRGATRGINSSAAYADVHNEEGGQKERGGTEGERKGCVMYFY